MAAWTLRALFSKEVVDRNDEWRVADEPRLAVHDAYQLVERLDAVLGPGLRHVAGEPLLLTPVQLLLHLCGDVVDIQAGVPQVEGPHLSHVVHRLAVGLHHRQVRRPALLGVEAPVSAGDLETGDQPFDVPFEWAGECLVEVVDAEDEPPIRGSEDAEVR